MNPFRSLTIPFHAASAPSTSRRKTPWLPAMFLVLMCVGAGTARTSSASNLATLNCGGPGCAAEPQGGSFAVYVTMAVATDDPALCGTRTELRVPVGTVMNFCYFAMNESSYALTPHTLVDSVDGVLFENNPLVIEPFTTYQFNRTVIASETSDYSSVWTASGFDGGDFGAYETMRLVVIGTPTVSATPTAVSAPVALSGTGTRTLQIGNAGDQILRWEINETSGPQGGPHPGGAVPVPAVGVCAFDCTSWTSLNLSDPEFLRDLINPKPGNFQAQTFIDDDFDKVYMVTNVGGGGSFPIAPNMLATIDARKGVFDQFGYTVIGPVTGATGGGDVWDGMKWDATTGNVYLLSHNILFTLDVDSAVATPVGQIEGPGVGADAEIIDISVAPDGTMVGLDWIDDVLLEIDKTTGRASVIGPLGVDADVVRGGMDFDASTGLLYWAGYTVDGKGESHSDMYTIDTSTGAATAYAPLTNSNTFALSSLSIAVPRSACPLSGDAPWLTVTVSDGAGTIAVNGAPQTIALAFDATGLSAGTYTTSLCVRSNDPNHRTLAVPVEMVVAADVVFADGFES